MENSFSVGMEREPLIVEVMYLEMRLVHPQMIYYRFDFYTNAIVDQELWRNTGMTSAVQIANVVSG